MRAVVCRELGPFDQVLELGDLDPPPLPPSGVRIAVGAAGINFADTLIVQGRYQVRPTPPFVPGFEVAGRVLEVGAEATDFRPGDRVLATLSGGGGWAEQCVAPAGQVHRLPDGMSEILGAALPIAYGTSHFALVELARLKPAETLLVHGAAGGVGLTAVEIGRHLEATVIASAGGPDKLAVAASAGAEHLIDYRTEDIREAVKRITDGRGADVVYDPVGGATWEASLRCVAPGARMLVIGFAAGEIQSIPANILLVKNVAAIGLNWTGMQLVDPTRVHQSLAEALSWVAAGRLTPPAPSTFELESAVEALALLKSRKASGKIVLGI